MLQEVQWVAVTRCPSLELEWWWPRLPSECLSSWSQSWACYSTGIFCSLWSSRSRYTHPFFLHLQEKIGRLYPRFSTGVGSPHSTVITQDLQTANRFTFPLNLWHADSLLFDLSSQKVFNLTAVGLSCCRMTQIFARDSMTILITFMNVQCCAMKNWVIFLHVLHFAIIAPLAIGTSTHKKHNRPAFLVWP